MWHNWWMSIFSWLRGRWRNRLVFIGRGHVGRSLYVGFLHIVTLHIWYSMQNHVFTIVRWLCIWLGCCIFYGEVACIGGSFTWFRRLRCLICISFIFLFLLHRRWCRYGCGGERVVGGWRWLSRRLVGCLGGI
jgi:hypothetical protein